MTPALICVSSGSKSIRLKPWHHPQLLSFQHHLQNLQSPCCHPDTETTTFFCVTCGPLLFSLLFQVIISKQIILLETLARVIFEKHKLCYVDTFLKQL